MNKRSFFKLLFMFSAVAFLSSCVLWINGTAGEGSIVEQEISVSGFSAIESSSSAEVIVTKGQALKVTLSDYENLIELWDIKVINNVLVVQTKPFTSLINSKAIVTVVMPSGLSELRVSGSGDIKLNSAFPEIEKASISGSGSIHGNNSADYTKLNFTISGSGSFNFKGKVDVLKTLTSGSGRMYLSDLVAKSATCSISGSGNQYINAVDYLKASISGSGDIVYSGVPVLEVQSSGSGRVRHQ